MSEFSVHRTADRIPALRYCLVLDGTRIAGGKPDYRGDNHLISWQTDETYGPVDDLMADNRKLRELVRDMWDFYCVVPDEPHASKEEIDFSVEVWSRMRELGVEVDE